jgi:O-antigen/teichoic acid export membrane protein
VQSALRQVALVSAGAAALGVVIVLLVDDGGPDARGAALLVALPIIPLLSLVLIAQGTLLGLGRTASALAPPMLVRQVAFTALVAAAVLAGGLSAAGAVGLQAAAAVAAGVVAAVLLRRALAAQAVSTPAPAGGGGRVGPAPREWLRSSLPMGATAMLLIIESQIGLLVLGAVSNPVETGLYAAAFQCTAPFALLLTVGRLPLGPVVARLRAAGERERLQRGLRVATRGVAAIGAVVAAVLLVVPEAVLGLFGSDFTGGAGALRLLAVAQVVNLLSAFNGMVLIMGGEERAAMRTTIACFVLDVALCLALVPSLGARGAAIAVLASVTVRNVANSLATRRLIGVDATVIGRMPAPRRGATRR